MPVDSAAQPQPPSDSYSSWFSVAENASGFGNSILAMLERCLRILPHHQYCDQIISPLLAVLFGDGHAPNALLRSASAYLLNQLMAGQMGLVEDDERAANFVRSLREEDVTVADQNYALDARFEKNIG